MIKKAVVAFVGCFLSVICSPAQIVQVAAIPTETFDYVAASQQGDELCWAASVQMILNFYRINVNQNEIETRVFGQTINHTGSDKDISNALDGWAVGLDGQKKLVRSFMKGGLPEPSVLVDQLSQGHPILLTFATGAYSGHAVVITGATYLPGPQIQSLVIRDPFPTAENIKNKGRVEISGQQLGNFLSLVRNHWLVSVQDVAGAPAPKLSTSTLKSSASAPVVKAAEPPQVAADDQTPDFEKKDAAEKATAVNDALHVCEFDYQDCIDAIPSHDACIQKRVTGCMTSCIEDHHIPAQVCRDEKCSPASAGNFRFEDRCADYAERDKARCTSKRKTCRSLAM